MKFLIITTYGQYTISAEDMGAALDEVYDNHTGYKNIQAIVRIDEE